MGTYPDGNHCGARSSNGVHQSRREVSPEASFRKYVQQGPPGRAAAGSAGKGKHRGSLGVYPSKDGSAGSTPSSS